MHAVVPREFLVISSVNIIIIVVMHVKRMHDRPHPWGMPPRSAKNTESGRSPPTLTDLYCPVCRPIMSCCIFFGKPIALMHSCITINGMKSKHAARSVSSKWIDDFVSMAFSIDMFIRSIAL